MCNAVCAHQSASQSAMALRTVGYDGAKALSMQRSSRAVRAVLPAVKKQKFFSLFRLLICLPSFFRLLSSDAPSRLCVPHTQRRDATWPSAAESDHIENIRYYTQGLFPPTCDFGVAITMMQFL
jgi:hypothetical protein